MRTSFNGRLREYWGDVAGMSTARFDEMDASFDSWTRHFDTHSGHSLNDTMRMGLERLGYGGAEPAHFDEIHTIFDTLDSKFAGSRALMTMLREWANDQALGALSWDFNDLDERFDSVPYLFAAGPVSINTALRMATGATQSTDDAFDQLRWCFNQLVHSFDAADIGLTITADEFFRYTFGNAVEGAFEKVHVDFEDIPVAFGGGGDRTQVLTTYDRENRMFNYINK